MDISGAEQATYSLIARRNCSLSSFGRDLVVVFIAFVSIGVALVFAALGAWLILPFAGIEVLVLYLAFRYVGRHAGDYEQLTIDGSTFSLEFFDAGKLHRLEFNRFWARVDCDDQQRLTVRSHGRAIEFGRHLTGRQRVALARRLKKYLGSIQERGV